MAKKDETKIKLLEMLERERGYSKAFLEDLWLLKEKTWGPLAKDKLMKELAVRFGEFLITMNVSSVEYSHKGNKTYKTNCGMAPDMIIESMENMFDRFAESESHWANLKN